jgi:hypothetical protein
MSAMIIVKGMRLRTHDPPGQTSLTSVACNFTKTDAYLPPFLRFFVILVCSSCYYSRLKEAYCVHMHDPNK